MGDSAVTDTTAQPTADESNAPETGNLGQLNRDLQLAREELEALRLEGDELSERDVELSATSDNMDALVELRQNEVARLEQQLADARSQSELSQVGDAAATTTTDALTDSASDSDAAATDSTGQQVELLDSGADATTNVSGTDTVAPTTAAAPIGASEPWYKRLLSGDRNVLMTAGIGLLGLLGLLGTLFWRRRRDDDRFDLYEDEVEFLDDDGQPVQYADDTGDYHAEDAHDRSSAVAGAATAAAAGGAAMVAVSSDAEADTHEEYDTAAAAGSTQADSATDIIADGAADDTLSEADVYLAYGLHGQATELLNQGIANDPGNTEYHYKLLEAYHGQSNAEGFQTAAARYHNEFGGDSSPRWSEVAAMGHQLNPSAPLFGGAGEPVESIGKGGLGAATLDDTDFVVSADSTASVASNVRGIDSPSSNAETLMDQSIDPALALSEEDHEATGDFTQLANEIRDTPEPDTGGLSAGVAAAGAGIAATGAGVAAAAGDQLEAAKDMFAEASEKVAGGVEVPEGANVGGAAASLVDSAADDGMVDFDLTQLDDTTDRSNVTPIASAAPAASDDLTLDLDQLASDLDASSLDLQVGDASVAGADPIDVPDLTSSNELTSDASGAFGSADEMDTMMDLAKAYIDMGDKDSASSALGEIVKSGSPAQKSEAETLLQKIS